MDAQTITAIKELFTKIIERNVNQMPVHGSMTKQINRREQT
jgi:hypothetical protein